MNPPRFRRLGWVFACLLCFPLVGLGTACRFRRVEDRPTPLPQDVEPNDLVDASYASQPSDPLGPLDSAEIERVVVQRRAEAAVARRAREERVSKATGKPYKQREYNLLLLSGGGVYGAYPAGVLCGWTASGKPPDAGGRPTFDVVTGVSTGALIAPMAFLGSEYDELMKSFFTTVRNDDIFKIRRSIRSYFAESLADNSPLRKKIDSVITSELMAKIAAENAKGRRLYVGTTNLDTKRLVVWDIGAIAAKGTAESRALIVNVILASAAIPGFFPSERFNITIDGRPYEEMHVDGGVARALFFRPPYIPPEEPEHDADSLTGTNLFAMVAGKAYPDPEGIKPRTIAIVGAAVSNLLYVSARNDLYRFYMYSMITGMDFFAALIPPDLKVTNSSTNFDSKETRKMFEEGYRLGARGAFTKKPRVDPKGTTDEPKYYTYADGTKILFKEPGPAWRNSPPGVEAGERSRNRAGLELVVKPTDNAQKQTKGTDQNVGGAPPVAK